MKPPWLKAKIPSGPHYHHLKTMLGKLQLHTVCEEAQCPNLADCWDRQTATVMIMGDTCTRSCGFCAVKTGRPLPLDPLEPLHVAEAVSRLGLKHVVITSVDRDDLKDGGANHFAETIRQVKQHCPEMRVEVLIPDMKGRKENLEKIFSARPDFLNHNLETVRSLQQQVRPQSSYECSLSVLRAADAAGLIVKSGIMFGLGETEDEIRQTLYDLREEGKVRVLTLGQYLRPSPQHLEVRRYYSPQEFEFWKRYAKELGFEYVASGPLASTVPRP